jgi:hypothetical protein
MYIRFVVDKLDCDSGKRQGLFQTIDELFEKNLLHKYEEDIVKEIRKWFSNHLEKPDSFTRSSTPHAINKAISWFKPTAKEHIDKMRQLTAIIEGHGIHVHVIRTDRPGYVVYEDEYQITAEPYSETKT